LMNKNPAYRILAGFFVRTGSNIAFHHQAG